MCHHRLAKDFSCMSSVTVTGESRDSLDMAMWYAILVEVVTPASGMGCICLPDIFPPYAQGFLSLNAFLVSISGFLIL